MIMKPTRKFCPIISLSVMAVLLLSSAGFAEQDEDSVATLEGQPITREQVEVRAANKLYRLRWEIYDTLKTEAQALVDERLLAKEAKSRGITVDELLRAEIKQKSAAPTDEQVDAYIKENKVMARPGEDVRARIVAYLTDRASIQRRLDFLEELRKKAHYEFLVQPPQRPRAHLSVEGCPARGNADAPVTIIHFASFSCEHCADSARKIQRLTEEFPGMIKWVHRDFLNIFDERGLRAAEAAKTAQAQGKFWEFHDHIYSFSGDFTDNDLDKILRGVGVDPSEYEKAHKEATYILAIKRDIEEGAAAGVAGVPAVFINGRYVSGTFPYERLREMVEEELQAPGPKAKEQKSPLLENAGAANTPAR